MEFYISPQSGQFYMINVLENQWLSVTCDCDSVSDDVNSPVSMQLLTLVPNLTINERGVYNQQMLMICYLYF